MDINRLDADKIFKFSSLVLIFSTRFPGDTLFGEKPLTQQYPFLYKFVRPKIVLVVDVLTVPLLISNLEYSF
jgi:hypothetical protein